MLLNDWFIGSRIYPCTVFLSFFINNGQVLAKEKRRQYPRAGRMFELTLSFFGDKNTPFHFPLSPPPLPLLLFLFLYLLPLYLLFLLISAFVFFCQKTRRISVCGRNTVLNITLPFFMSVPAPNEPFHSCAFNEAQEMRKQLSVYSTTEMHALDTQFYSKFTVSFEWGHKPIQK